VKRWLLVGLLAGGILIALALDGTDAEPDAQANDAPRHETAAREGREQAPPPAATPTPPRCAHPLLPRRVGAALTYRLRGRRAEVTASHALAAGEGMAHLSYVGVETVGGMVHTQWRTTYTLDDPPEGGDGELTADIRLPCFPGEWAEMPWLRFPEPGGVKLDGDAWRWPTQLGEGRRFEGAFTIQMRPYREMVTIAEGRRVHRVLGRDEVTTPAGTYRAWRLSVKDEITGPRAPATNVQEVWVAEDVGLIRAIGKDSFEQVLTALEL
jgi:hypothetical protein